MKRVPLVWDLVLAALAIAAAVPVWVVKHPPIQDLPQHLAAIRVLHDYGNPELHFAQYFDIHVGRTQYLTYYVLTHLLSYPLGLVTANKVVLTATIVGLPYSMRALLTVLGRDPRIALFALPLVWNTHLLLGFVNFAAAVPLALWGVALAVGLRLRWGRSQALLLSVLALLTFYTHVVPFGFLALGVVLTALDSDKRAMVLRLLPLGPALVGMLVWTRTSPAARTLLGAIVLDEAGAQPEHHPFSRSIKDLGSWLFDVLPSEADDQMLVAWVLLLVAAVALGAGPSIGDDRPSEDDVLRGALLRRLALLGPVAFVAYFFAPASYDWIWPINARFPLIGATFLLLALPAPRRLFALPLYAGAALVSLLFFHRVGVAFRESQKELGDVEAAIGSIPKGQRVAGLVWDRDSRFVRGSPYLHVAAMYQAARGGAVMFSFAEYPQSPFSFKAENRPPKVPRRWEWSPMFVRPVPDLDWFDYVITRGDPGSLRLHAEAFDLHYGGAFWQVWKRRDARLPFEGGEVVQRMLSDGPALTAHQAPSCAAVAAKAPDGSLQSALQEIAARASSRKGNCTGVGEAGRSCRLVLARESNDRSAFSLEVAFTVESGSVVPASLVCRGALPPSD